MSAKKSTAPKAQPETAEDTSPAQVLRQFRVVFNAVRTHFREVEKQIGLGGAQVWALSLIKANPGIGIGGISAAMDIHQSTASNLVKALQKRELVELTKSSEDRRSVCLTILPAGKTLLKNAPGPFEGVLPVALAQLDRATLRRLNLDLQKVIELLHADEGAAAIPLAQL